MIRQTLAELLLDQLWIRVFAAGAEIDEQPAFGLELISLDHGQSMAIDPVAERLSQGRLLLRLSPGADHVRAELFSAGERLLDRKAPRETIARLLADDHQIRIDWRALEQNLPPNRAEIATEDTSLMIRGRFLSAPVASPRAPQLYQFHAHVALDDDHDQQEPADQVIFVMLDLERAEELWHLPSARLAQFLEMIAPFGRAVLGPLTDTLAEVVEAVEAMDGDVSAAGQPSPNLLLYEVLAVATAVGFSVGDDLESYDSRYLPLLSLSPGAITPALLEGNLDDIDGMDVLSAMAEILPYSVPEGELLECLDDGEIKPLAPWAIRDDEYAGSLFVVDHGRLRSLLDAFDPETFTARVNAFLRAWYDALAPVGQSFTFWQRRREELDPPQLAMFGHTLAELRQVIRLIDANALSLGLLFYSE